MTTTPTLREAAQQALEALDEIASDYADRFDLNSPSTNPGIKSSIAEARSASSTLRAALAEQAGDDYDQLACAEEVLDGLCAHLPMTETSFDCLGDYIKAAVAAIRAPAAEWLQWVAEDGYRTDRERGAARELLPLAHATPAAPAAEQAEPVTVPAPIVAGAIFDFAGFLTAHKRVIKVGSTANASPVVERIKEWAGLRGLPIDDADVLSWQKNTAPPAPAAAAPVDVPDGYALVKVRDEEHRRQLIADAMFPPAPARQEWQPIETAPTDTEVLIGAWIDGEFKWGRSVRFYDSGNEREGEPACGWVWSIDDCSDSVAENPTLWQPLPAAPITAAPAEGGAA